MKAMSAIEASLKAMKAGTIEDVSTRSVQKTYKERTSTQHCTFQVDFSRQQTDTDAVCSWLVLAAGCLMILCDAG